MTIALPASRTSEAASQRNGVAPSLQMYQLDQDVEGRLIRYADHPITFEEYIKIETRERIELVRGVLEIMSASWPHEEVYAWLFSVMNTYVRHCKIGIASGSRTAVKIDVHSGRLPDILFVRQARLNTIDSQEGLQERPDLVVEFVSPSDRAGHILEVEADYRLSGVPEIVFINPQKRNVRVVLRQEDGSYATTTLTAGDWYSEAVAGFHVPVTWLLSEPRPDEYETITALIQEYERANPQPKTKTRKKKA